MKRDKKENKKIVGGAEKVMSIWAKIGSVLMAPLIVLLFVSLFSILSEVFVDGPRLLIANIFVFLLYGCLIYYAWFKKDDKRIKILAKVLTVASIGLIFFDMTIETFTQAGIILPPLFYYAWRK